MQCVLRTLLLTIFAEVWTARLLVSSGNAQNTAAAAQHSQSTSNSLTQYSWEDTDADEMGALFNARRGNCTDKVYFILQQAKLHHKGLQFITFTTRPAALTRPTESHSQFLNIRYWHPVYSCYVYMKVPFFRKDSIGDISKKAAYLSDNRIPLNKAKIWLEDIPLYNDKPIIYFTNSIYNGGQLTLRRDTMREKKSLRQSFVNN